MQRIPARLIWRTNNQNGSFVLTALVRDNVRWFDGSFYKDVTYYDYSEREARKRFRAQCEEEHLTIID